jgi:hypothetical protein
VYSERPPSATDRIKRVKTQISPVCNGARRRHSIKEPQRHTNGKPFHRQGDPMDINTITFAFVIVALGIGGVIVYLKGK